MLLVCLTTLRYRNTCKRQNFFSSNLPNHKEQGQPKGWPCSFSLSKTRIWRKSVSFCGGSTRGREPPRVGSNACKRAAAAARCAAKRHAHLSVQSGEARSFGQRLLFAPQSRQKARRCSGCQSVSNSVAFAGRSCYDRAMAPICPRRRSRKPSRVSAPPAYSRMEER